MADDDKTESAPAPAPRAKPSLLLIILVTLNLGATGYAGVRVTLGQAAPGDAAAAEGEVEPDGGPDEPGPVYELERPFVVNLNEAKGGRYLKVQISVELADGDALKALAKAEQIVRDDILRYLSGLTVDSAIGADSKDTISAAIVDRLDVILGGSDRARRVFFSEFVIQ